MLRQPLGDPESDEENTVFLAFDIEEINSSEGSVRPRGLFDIPLGQPSDESTMSGTSIPSFQHSSDTNSNDEDEASLESDESKEETKGVRSKDDDASSVATDLAVLAADLGIEKCQDLKPPARQDHHPSARRTLPFQNFPDDEMDPLIPPDTPPEEREKAKRDMAELRRSNAEWLEKARKILEEDDDDDKPRKKKQRVSGGSETDSTSDSSFDSSASSSKPKKAATKN
jgi:hypothetical protein